MGLIFAATAGLCLWIIFWSGELGVFWRDLKLGGFDGLGYGGERSESCFQGRRMATAAGRR